MMRRKEEGSQERRGREKWRAEETEREVKITCMSVLTERHASVIRSEWLL